MRIDLRNAYNETDRTVALARMAAVPSLAHLVPFMHAVSGHETDIFVGATRRRLFEGQDRGDSSDGFRQGSVEGAPGFCVAIHPEVVALDASLRSAGGGAWFCMDDGYAVGPAAVVFPAVMRFAEAVREALRLVVRVDKLSCFSPEYDLECPATGADIDLH